LDPTQDPIGVKDEDQEMVRVTAGILEPISGKSEGKIVKESEGCEADNELFPNVQSSCKFSVQYKIEKNLQKARPFSDTIF